MNSTKRTWCLVVFLIAAGVFAGMHLIAQDGEYYLSITIEGEEYTLTKGFYRELMQGETTSLTLDPVPVGWIDGRTSYIMASSYIMTSQEMDTILGYGGFVPMFQDEGSLAYITVNGAAASGKVFTAELFFMHITETFMVMAMSYDLEIRFETVDDIMTGTFTGNMMGVQGKPQTPGSYTMFPGKGSFMVKTEQ